MPQKSAMPSPADLLAAVCAGDLAGVQDLLAAGAKPDKRPAGMETPLIAAVRKGHAEIARVLLKAGANPSLKSGQRRGATTALLDAIRSQQFELACELVAAGADVRFDWSGQGTNITHDAIETCNTLCREANAPLPKNRMGIVHKGKGPEAQARARKVFPASLKLVQMLLEAGGRPGKPILPSCAGSGNLPVQRLLLAHGIDVNEEEQYSGSAFNYAISQCQTAAALELLKAGADPNAGDTIMGPPFHSAVVEGMIDIIKGIIAVGGNLNFRGTVSLKEEVKPEPEPENGRPRFRLNMGADFVPNKQARDSTPLIVAVRARQTEIIRLLVEAKANLEVVDADGFTAFAWAEALGLGDVAALLRSAGALEKKSGEGSPFHVLFKACQSGDLARASEAIAAGADVNAVKEVNRGTMTPLMAAAGHGHVAVVEALLQAGANPDLAGLEELAMLVSPLMLAARHGQVEIVKRLLEAGASADAPGRQLFRLREEGDAAIHEAARNGHPKVVELLLQFGVKKTSRSEWSGSVLAAAVQGGNLETVKVMLAAGVTPTAKNLANLLAMAKGPQQADIVRELQAATP